MVGNQGLAGYLEASASQTGKLPPMSASKCPPNQRRAVMTCFLHQHSHSKYVHGCDVELYVQRLPKVPNFVTRTCFPDFFTFS